MRVTQKDLAATVLTVLAVLTFAATHEGWNVWLVGGSHRWAAGAITLLGGVACGLGSPGKDTASRLLGTFGAVAGALAIAALATGSLTLVSLLTLDVVVLWAAALIRHQSAPAVHA